MVMHDSDCSENFSFYHSSFFLPSFSFFFILHTSFSFFFFFYHFDTFIIISSIFKNYYEFLINNFHWLTINGLVRQAFWYVRTGNWKKKIVPTAVYVYNGMSSTCSLTYCLLSLCCLIGEWYKEKKKAWF